MASDTMAAGKRTSAKEWSNSGQVNLLMRVQLAYIFSANEFGYLAMIFSGEFRRMRGIGAVLGFYCTALDQSRPRHDKKMPHIPRLVQMPLHLMHWNLPPFLSYVRP